MTPIAVQSSKANDESTRTEIDRIRREILAATQRVAELQQQLSKLEQQSTVEQPPAPALASPPAGGTSPCDRALDPEVFAREVDGMRDVCPAQRDLARLPSAIAAVDMDLGAGADSLEVRRGERSIELVARDTKGGFAVLGALGWEGGVLSWRWHRVSAGLFADALRDADALLRTARITVRLTDGSECSFRGPPAEFPAEGSPPRTDPMGESGRSPAWQSLADPFEGLEVEYRARFPGDPPPKRGDPTGFDRHIESLREFIKPINGRPGTDVTWTVKIASVERIAGGGGRIRVYLSPADRDGPWKIPIEGSEETFSDVLVRGEPIDGDLTLSANVDLELSVDSSGPAQGKKQSSMLVAPYLTCNPRVTLKSIAPATAVVAGPEMGLAKALLKEIRNSQFLDSEICRLGLELGSARLDFRSRLPSPAELAPRAKRLGTLRSHPALSGEPSAVQDELLARFQMEVLQEMTMSRLEQQEKFWTNAHKLNGQGPATIAGQIPTAPGESSRSLKPIVQKLDQRYVDDNGVQPPSWRPVAGSP